MPESELLKPLISRENIECWTCFIADCTKVLYLHFSKNGKRDAYDLAKFPNAEKYLKKHKLQLEAREYLIQSGRKWYEMCVPQNPEFWKFPKLVFPDICVEAKFSYDESGAIVN